jgi:protein tyrosine phosphatase
MLCKLEENGKEKCVEYWEPEKRNIFDSTVNIYNFKVNYTTEQINEDITIRNCHVLDKTTNAEKEIKQIHYGGWPDHEIPKDIQAVYGNILFMFNIVDNIIKQTPNCPICVHCSAGVGRTGTFIALYNIYRDILHQLEDKKSKRISFSLMNLVRKLKEMRLYLVENDDQYKMIYQFISKLLNDRN